MEYTTVKGNYLVEPCTLEDIPKHYQCIAPLTNHLTETQKQEYLGRMVEALDHFAYKVIHNTQLYGFLYCTFPNKVGYPVSMYSTETLTTVLIGNHLNDYTYIHKLLFTPHTQKIPYRSLIYKDSIRKYRIAKKPLTILWRTVTPRLTKLVNRYNIEVVNG